MTVPRGTAYAHFPSKHTTGQGHHMDTAHDRPISWSDRLPAQLLALAALGCAVVAFFHSDSATGFLLAVTGVVLALAAAALTPDGWLVADGEADS